MNLIKVKTARDGSNMLHKSNGLKQFFENDFIKKNDKNYGLQLNNKAEPRKYNDPPKTRCRKPVQRILNSEIGGENSEVMQPLMNIDNQIYPVTSEMEIDQLEVETTVKPKPKLPRPVKKRNIVKKNLQFIECKSTISERNGFVIKKSIHYDTWYVIKPMNWPTENRVQCQLLDFPLVKLANASSRMTLPSDQWITKVVLHKVSPALLRRHTLTIYAGDLKLQNIPERDRKKYQPTAVVFRRKAREQHGEQEHNKNQVTFDRVIICTNKCIKISFDGKYVQLNGAPDAVACLQDVQKLLDIVHCISLSNPMVEIMQRQIYEAEI